ncbi:hypothetical protein [Pseudoroseicyclus tamaricis]|uniref:Secreted protein n=1 Tax=Pseudoroseicyclus tamaricis TaxID=2705421 RepID=A0A6B2K102_9RHOB|nr:hypothetical protein [Pseudoroseicyclus tamaricis]NDV02114.1 hypothetical protein [Pseudoroseicyclus tamaricis]
MPTPAAGLVALALLAAPAGAHALGAEPCGGRVGIDDLVEPWAETSATFAEGEVRVALIDFVEPAGGPFHLALITPPRDELGLRQCLLITREGALGWWSLDFETLEAVYDPATGLTFTIEGATPLPDESAFPPVRVTVTLNQATGQITVTEEPA